MFCAENVDFAYNYTYTPYSLDNVKGYGFLTYWYKISIKIGILCHFCGNRKKVTFSRKEYTYRDLWEKTEFFYRKLILFFSEIHRFLDDFYKKIHLFIDNILTYHVMYDKRKAYFSVAFYRGSQIHKSNASPWFVWYCKRTYGVCFQ